MMAWLDARTGGLAIEFDLEHVVKACEAPVVVPLATLCGRRAATRLRLIQ
jgi:hypothetical protein